MKWEIYRYQIVRECAAQPLDRTATAWFLEKKIDIIGSNLNSYYFSFLSQIPFHPPISQLQADNEVSSKCNCQKNQWSSFRMFHIYWHWRFGVGATVDVDDSRDRVDRCVHVETVLEGGLDVVRVLFYLWKEEVMFWISWLWCWSCLFVCLWKEEVFKSGIFSRKRRMFLCLLLGIEVMLWRDSLRQYDFPYIPLDEEELHHQVR